MGIVVWLLVLLCGYVAYRAIRGGFGRSQSDRLNVFGVLGCLVLLLVLGLFGY
jgi:hypothetical protein